MNATRRELLRGLAAVAVAPAMVLGDAPPASQESPIIDTHQHLWDLSKFTLPWFSNAKKFYAI